MAGPMRDPRRGTRATPRDSTPRQTSHRPLALDVCNLFAADCGVCVVSSTLYLVYLINKALDTVWDGPERQW